MALEEKFTFSWGHWGDLVGSLSIITIWKNETTLVHSRINLQVRYAVHKNIEKQGLSQTQLKIFFYIDDTPSNHTWGKKNWRLSMWKNMVYL